MVTPSGPVRIYIKPAGPVGPLYHGGVPGLRPGDLLTPGHTRRGHDGCPWCAARKNGTIPAALDGPSEQHAVYVTTHRLYAAHYASLYGRGDLYRIEPDGPITPSTEDTIPTWHTPQARVAAVLDRAVLLRPTDRRRLLRDWTAADHAAGTAPAHALLRGAGAILTGVTLDTPR